MIEPEERFAAIFRDESRRRLDEMVEALLAVERGAPTRDVIDELFRHAHTIKGGAGMVGLDSVGELAGGVEEVLGRVREQGDFPPELLEPLLRATDSMRGQLEGASASNDELLSELAAQKAALGGNGSVVREQPRPVPPRASINRSMLRVSQAKVDDLVDLVGEAAVYRRKLKHSLRDIVEDHPDVAEGLDTGERIFDELKETALRMRTLPLTSISSGFPRAVRDLAAAEGKQVELSVLGSETELDRAILEGLSDPLVHLLRNAVAHGIEPPEERERAGKPPAGHVEVRARHHGPSVEIVVADDGRGVSRKALAAAEREGSLADVLAEPGYSTASEVTELSGRGVGLDVVGSYVNSVGGTLEAVSEPGRGTEMVVRVPFALALQEVLLVERGGGVFGIPLGAVEEAVGVTRTLSLGGRQAIDVRGSSVAIADLATLVGAHAAALEPQHPALVVSAGGRRAAVACDALVGQEDVVVKPLGPLLDAEWYQGAAILGDGRIALLLEPSALTRLAHRAPRALPPEPVAPTEPKAGARILVVEDSFTVRELQRSILEAAGYRVVTARDGAEALETLRRDDQVELVVTDLEMPEVDGFELTRRIRADATRSSLPVVIVTSRGEEDDRLRGLEAGADAYMAKRSFDQGALLETVGRLVGRL